MIIYKNKSNQEVPIFMEDGAGVPLLSLVPSQIAIYKYKEGLTDFVPAGFASSEAGSGWYVYTPTSADVGDIGVTIYQGRHSAAAEPGTTLVDVIEDPDLLNQPYTRPRIKVKR